MKPMRQSFKDVIGKCCLLVCEANGRELRRSMVEAWIVVLSDDEDLEPHLVEATILTLKAPGRPTIAQIHDQAVELLKDARRAAKRTTEPSRALPAPSPESLQRHREKWREVLSKLMEKMDMNSRPTDDPEHLAKVRRQIDEQRSALSRR